MSKDYAIEARNLLNDWEGDMDQYGFALFSIAYSLVALLQQDNTAMKVKTDDGIDKKMEKASSILIDNIKSLRNADTELEQRCDEQDKWLASLDNRISAMETLLSRLEDKEQLKHERMNTLFGRLTTLEKHGSVVLSNRINTLEFDVNALIHRSK